MKKDSSPNNYLKVVDAGGSRTLAVTRVVPKDWKIVKLIKEDELFADDRQWVRVRIEKVA